MVLVMSVRATSASLVGGWGEEVCGEWGGYAYIVGRGNYMYPIHTIMMDSPVHLYNTQENTI